MIEKLICTNPHYSFLRTHRQEIREAIFKVEPPISEEDQRKLRKKLKEYNYQEIIEQLRKLGVPRGQARKIGEISENCMQKAI